MYTVQELTNKKSELEIQYNNLIKVAEEKKVQFEKDMQDIRDLQNELRGKYAVYDEMIKTLQNDDSDTVECTSEDIEEPQEDTNEASE